MADAFTNLAPRYMSDLIRDLDLTEEQAAGIVGNLAAESGLLAIQEKNPVSGRGGFGVAQWTGPRRVAFENWAKAKKLAITSYEANYGYLLHELQTSEKASIQKLKLTTTAKAAAETFEAAFERAGVKNWPARVKFAEKALALYRTVKPPVTPPIDPLAALKADLAAYKEATDKRLAELEARIAAISAASAGALP